MGADDIRRIFEKLDNLKSGQVQNATNIQWLCDASKIQGEKLNTIASLCPQHSRRLDMIEAGINSHELIADDDGSEIEASRKNGLKISHIPPRSLVAIVAILGAVGLGCMFLYVRDVQKTGDTDRQQQREQFQKDLHSLVLKMGESRREP